MTPRRPHEPPPRHEPPPPGHEPPPPRHEPPPPGHEPPPPRHEPPPGQEPLHIRVEKLERQIARIEDCLGSHEAEERGLVMRGPEQTRGPEQPPAHLEEMSKVILGRLEHLERQLGELEHRL